MGERANPCNELCNNQLNGDESLSEMIIVIMTDWTGNHLRGQNVGSSKQ